MMSEYIADENIIADRSFMQHYKSFQKKEKRFEEFAKQAHLPLYGFARISHISCGEIHDNVHVRIRGTTCALQINSNLRDQIFTVLGIEDPSQIEEHGLGVKVIIRGNHIKALKPIADPKKQ